MASLKELFSQEFPACAFSQFDVIRQVIESVSSHAFCFGRDRKFNPQQLISSLSALLEREIEGVMVLSVKSLEKKLPKQTDAKYWRKCCACSVTETMEGIARKIHTSMGRKQKFLRKASRVIAQTSFRKQMRALVKSMIPSFASVRFKSSERVACDAICSYYNMLMSAYIHDVALGIPSQSIENLLRFSCSYWVPFSNESDVWYVICE